MPATVVILFTINPFRIGGMEIFTRELARQLEPLHIRLVAVFSQFPKGVVAEFLTAPNLVIEAMPELDISERASIGPLYSLLRRYRPETLHLNFVGFVGPFPWVARACGVRRIFFTAHGSNATNQIARRAPTWKRLLVRVINAPLTRAFCVSRYSRQFLVELDVLPAERFQVLYNGILTPDLGTVQEMGSRFRERYGIPQDRLLITQVSWIIADKGIPQLLAAARQVLTLRPQTHFAIVGSGAQSDEYKRKALDLGIAEAITWTGLVENPMKDGVYAATDIFCLASQWQEAFGMVLAEAMAFEKPAVGSAIGGIPEVIEDGVTGLLVNPPTDVEQLARHLVRLLDDADLRRTMGLAGRKAVEQKFQLSRITAEVVRHYQIG
ncbi:MAG: glycosyltransferase family 4 protein [Acidobacteriota bacterium]